MHTDYHKLSQAYHAAFVNKKKRILQEETNVLWREIKSGEKQFDDELKKLKVRASKSKGNLFGLWANVPTSSKTSESPIVNQSSESSVLSATIENNTEIKEKSIVSQIKPNATAQQRAISELNDVEKDIANLYVVQKTIGLSNANKKSLDALCKRKKMLDNKLKRLQNNATAQQKKRSKVTKVLKNIMEINPQLVKSVKPQDGVGRPRLETREENMGLHEAILSIVVPESSADDRRRCEVYNSCRTLDNLKEKLESIGFHLTRTSLYYRLIPANIHHRDGKRHHSTVPVKLIKPENVQRKAHEDRPFAKAIVYQVEDFAMLFDPDSICYLSQDDKARIPLGLPISKKQTALIMHVDYKITLPDHDFPIGEKHKLIPSVYAACHMKDNKVSFSGPTYIALRSAKHDSSTANSHQYDFQRLTELDEFNQSIKNKIGEIKPILLVAVDGGPDESPSSQKTLVAWCNQFRNHDFDGVFVFCNAPGFSAYNKVERRMAPLSKDAAGIVLPFDTFGTHLNSSNKTIDEELEKKIFEAAGKILASVWSESIIDNFPVVAEYQSPGKTVEFKSVDQIWIDKHVRQSRYLLQIVKCKNLKCCKVSRTNYETIIGGRFLPAPVPVKRTTKGPVVHTGGSFGSLWQNINLARVTNTKVFDTFCPKMNHIKHHTGKTELQRRICSRCNIYYPTLAALKPHIAVCSFEVLHEDNDDLDLDQGDIPEFE